MYSRRLSFAKFQIGLKKLMWHVLWDTVYVDFTILLNHRVPTTIKVGRWKKNSHS